MSSHVLSCPLMSSHVLSCPLMSSEFSESVTRGDPRLFLSASCWGALHSSRAAHGVGESAWDSDHDALRGGLGTGWAIRRHEYVSWFVTRYGNPIPMVYHVFPIAVAVVGGIPFVIAVYIYLYIYIYVCVCACVCVCVCVWKCPSQEPCQIQKSMGFGWCKLYQNK